MIHKIISWSLRGANPCSSCYGYGYLTRWLRLDSITEISENLQCPVCHGYGVSPLPIIVKLFRKLGFING